MKIWFLSLVLLGLTSAQGVAMASISPVIQKELISLQVRLSETPDVKERFHEVQKTLVEIRDFQRAYPAKSLEEQGRINLLMAVMEFLPEPDTFKKEDCDKYRSEFINQFEPMAEEIPEDPSVLYGWDTLNRICS